MADGFFARIKKAGSIFRPSELKRRIEKRINTTLKRQAGILTESFREATPIGVTGNLHDGWDVETEPFKLRALIVNNADRGGFPYLFPVELGRRAAPVPIAPLEEWVQVKLGIQPPESRRVAFAISRKKSRTSTPGQRFVERTFQKRKDSITRALRNRIGVEVLQESNKS